MHSFEKNINCRMSIIISLLPQISITHRQLNTRAADTPKVANKNSRLILQHKKYGNMKNTAPRDNKMHHGPPDHYQAFSTGSQVNKPESQCLSLSLH